MNRNLKFTLLSLLLVALSISGVDAFGVPHSLAWTTHSLTSIQQQRSTITRSITIRRQEESHSTNYWNANSSHRHNDYNSALHAESEGKTAEATSPSADPAEIIARRIIVTGDVQGGYYRACVKNEASRFRKLLGTMSPPDDTKQAEIYVEGKRKMVESFIRWCKRGDVGLSQSIKVESVLDEYPTGLYDGFYIDTGRK
mmetsp:Transcript_4142/g.8537  ORF Transcript_4142/g.8537 Transcript_4142/m.8537 type:complete len:199 (-) Transcript_4142:90-686(-)